MSLPGFNRAKFMVTRQSYWPNGNKVVEVAQGGRDYSNPDMLSPRYDREGEEYDGVVATVEVAFKIAKWWASSDPELEITVGVGCTWGDTVPFEDGYELDDDSIADAMKRAEEFDAKLPRCSRCGEIIGGEPWKFVDCYTDDEFCSEDCVERAWYDLMEEFEDGDEDE